MNIVRPTAAEQWDVRGRSRPDNTWNRANFLEQLPLEFLVPVPRQIRPGKSQEGDRDSGLSHTGVERHELAKAAHKQDGRHKEDNRNCDLRNYHKTLQ